MRSPPVSQLALLPRASCSQCWRFPVKVNRAARLQPAARAADIRGIDSPFLQPATLLRVLPTTAAIGVAWALAWFTKGSIDASDWLPYAILLAVVLAAVLFAGAVVVPGRLPLAAAGLLVAFGLWTLTSLAWSPLPSLARDDALLCLVYAMAFVTPLVTLRTQAERLLAATIAVLALGLLAGVTALQVRDAASAGDVFTEGRLDFPVSYWNGAAALFLVGVWPAIALSADRRLGTVLRALALGGATAMVTVWLMTQSKGGAVALAVSGVVFLAVSRERLRALVPTLVVAGLGAAGAAALTAPYRAVDGRLLGAVHHAGTVALVLTGLGVAAGFVYALVDQRFTLPQSVSGRLGRPLALLLLVAALGGAIGFFADVGHPLGFVQARWASFKQLPKHEAASSHFTSLGSSRYDYYRVALKVFEQHPLIGLGGHGWPAAYDRYGLTTEGPERSHSLELDAASETGIIGLLLIVGAGAAGLASVTRRLGAPLLPAALFASGAYFAVHTAIDWVWSIPSVGIAALVLGGIGASRSGWRPLRPRIGVLAGSAVVVVAVLGFAPPWLSAGFRDRAYGEVGAAQASSLHWAERLDPLSVDPLLTQAVLAPSPHNIPPLERAVAMQPADAGVHYLLGVALLDAHRRADAHRELLVAHRLAPRDRGIQVTLRSAGARPG
jgi:hypothetical protein